MQAACRRLLLQTQTAPYLLSRVGPLTPRSATSRPSDFAHPVAAQQVEDRPDTSEGDELAGKHGKLPPRPAEPEPEDCCQSGCTFCVWTTYLEALQEWEDAREALVQTDTQKAPEPTNDGGRLRHLSRTATRNPAG
mmetsp:Transcript_3047/g.10969  ORF Transcript_3047/g.10969 Transcript_3047/m.10969 type:complete len:136 (+) Transcript_3047:114-521(+)|eukprot:scaffold1293_cov375-Prasinococcus_capsulatus_cf.AAC.16